MNESEERNIELLLRQLKESENIDLRSSAAKKLGFKKIHIDKIVPALIEALSDDNWLVRIESAKALAQIGRKALSALDALRGAMSEPRNKSKRPVFFEVIKTLETIESTEPEATPEEIIEEKIEPIEEITVEKIEHVIEEVISEESTFEEVSIEQVEVIEEKIDEDEKEKIEEVIEDYLEDAVEDALEDAIEEVADESFDEDIIENIAEDIAEEVTEDIAEEIVEEIIESEEKADELIVETEHVELDDQLQTEIKSLEEKIEEQFTETEEFSEEEEEQEEEQITEEVLEETTEDVIEEVIEEEKIEESILDDITEEALDEKEETKEDITLDKVLVFDEEEEEKKKINERFLILPPDQDESLSEDIPTRKMSSSLVKVILVGDKSVGKTAIRKGYCDVGFKSEYKEVIGADFATKHFIMDEKNFALQVWDIAAKERFEQNKVIYFRGTNGVMLVFDITQRSSFNNILNWFANIREIESGKIAYVLVGNKVDLRSTNIDCISFEEGQELASKLSLLCGTSVPYIETSASTGEAVSDAFQTLENKAAAVFLKE
ncbi:MAG: GTP-binding protein [Candidatus Heimdallarchaeota archaeon]|nr:GTP-binding protein [Candidatus Heimdallarchaeota archaeon]